MKYHQGLNMNHLLKGDTDFYDGSANHFYLSSIPEMAHLPYWAMNLLIRLSLYSIDRFGIKFFMIDDKTCFINSF